MTPEQRQQSLAAARRACERLSGYKFSTKEICKFQQDTSPSLGFFAYNLEELIDHLITGFQLLDAKEQKQIKGGAKGAKFGKRGGRPKTKLS